MNDMKSFNLSSDHYLAVVAVPWSHGGRIGSEHLAHRRLPDNAPVSHSDPSEDWIDALESGLEEFTDRKHTRFHRRDIQLLVRPDYRWLSPFGLQGFRNAKLHDISISGASFSLAYPLGSKRVSLQVRFNDDVEFLLPARLIGPQGTEVQRVRFLRHSQTFADHLLKSSLGLRFHDTERFCEPIEQPA